MSLALAKLPAVFLCTYMRKDIVRPSADEIFLEMAFTASKRSHDAQTQCGCVLTKNGAVISTGYNGFIREINDEVLPNTRPDKYPFMIHAEHNAILSCARRGESTDGATAYITSGPCLGCLQLLWQAGIKKIVHGNSPVFMTENPIFIQQKKTILDLIGNRLEIVEMSTNASV